ncbi:CRAL-TRIO domain-containing protein [Aspergillus saccharolyticus JOP 1030-1]|uniref:CRAL/TRIO domain-containing protein n=1 Tax=Aspergillus saccharolyticus JOP 1030-1 TaxID=1450539 RepID=A0A318Z9D3_9EURO|nr:CRAL/TRIO domain-containing protein [Aspergillus saccharolyticus JOP 1030-1]PYH40160.1 CRAL/TRIO domain-containing protein [Aspergillus saccharolyticus JOP 1030-1]
MVCLESNTASAAVLASFKARCAEQGLLDRPQGLQEGDVVDGLTDDLTLLRFLQARQLDPSSALQQFEAAIHFRRDKNLAHIYDTISIQDYEATRQLYPNWIGRRDTHGRPLVFLDVANLHPAALTRWRSTRSVEAGPDLAQRACAVLDALTRFVLPLCTAAAAQPITKSIFLIDMKAITIKQGWNVRDFAKEISGTLATCYPETIETIYVCNAPVYFSTVWAIVKNFIDPVTADKMVFLNDSQVYPALETIIDHANIPQQFGGALPVTHGMPPDLDPDLRLLLGEEKAVLPEGPLKWTEDDSGRRVLVATGSTEEGLRRECLATL